MKVLPAIQAANNKKHSNSNKKLDLNDTLHSISRSLNLFGTERKPRWPIVSQWCTTKSLYSNYRSGLMPSLATTAGQKEAIKVI